MKEVKKKIIDLGTKEEVTWCPGCPNFMILASVKKLLVILLTREKARRFAMVTDIGCHAKFLIMLILVGFMVCMEELLQPQLESH